MDFCPGCHLRYDKLHHATNARKTRNLEKGQIDCIDHMTEQEAIQGLLADLENNKMKVVLVPAPEPRHGLHIEGRGGHMIRAVESRPPKWYLEIAASWGYDKKGRGRIERKKFVRALERIKDGKPSYHKNDSYYSACKAIIRKAIEVPEEVFCA